MHRAELLPHPTTPCTAVRTIVVEIENRGALWLRFRMLGTLDAIVVTPAGAAPATRRDGLWRHTCCEAFVADREGRGYREFNFAPSGDWAAYRFDDYRTGIQQPHCPAPRIETWTAAGELVLEATVAEPGVLGALGACCVIEERSGRLSYWALAHPGERPDFHHRAGFLVPPGSAA